MVTVSSLRGSSYPVTCHKCGDALIAPQYAEYFSEEHLILNLWCCERCGNRFETEVSMPAGVADDIARNGREEFRPVIAA